MSNMRRQGERIGCSHRYGEEAQACEPVVFHRPARRRWGGGRRVLLAGTVLAVLLLVLVGALGFLAVNAGSATDFSMKNLPPCFAHPFGTDWMGRDMLLRTFAGLSTSLAVGLVSAVVSSLIAFALAAAAAFGGARVDACVAWLIDLVMGVPHIVLLILISYALGRGTTGVMVGIAVTHWPSLARVLRAEMLQLRAQPFMACSRALGESRVRMVCAHVLPAVLPQYLIGLVLSFPHAILHEASVTFLGFGLPPELPSVGVILSESMAYLTAGYWWLAVFPGAALLSLVLLFERLGAQVCRLMSPGGVQS